MMSSTWRLAMNTLHSVRFADSGSVHVQQAAMSVHEMCPANKRYNKPRQPFCDEAYKQLSSRISHQHHDHALRYRL